MNDIISKKYKLGEYRIFFIYEPKKRVIEALPFKDRVVIKCFCDVVLRNKKEQPNEANIGLPLGNQSSQWFALLYLNVIDRFVKEVLRVKGYIRYMDDMILIHRDKGYLQNCLKEIENKCKTELKLSLNQKTQIGVVRNGIDFLGYRHILNKNGSITRKLRVSSKQRLKRHLKTLKKLRDKDIVDDNYVYIRKNAFYNHIKDTKENKKLKEDSFPKKS